MVRIASPNATSPSARQLALRVRDPADDLVGVERHADHAGRGDGDAVLGTPAAAAPARCMRAASSSPRRPVAALALPALATTARMPAGRQRSWVSRTGAASTPERVKRAALTVLGRVADEQAEVARAGRLEAAGDAGGAEALRQARPAAR